MMRYTNQESQHHMDTAKAKAMSPNVPATATLPLKVYSPGDRSDECLQTCAELLCRIDEAQLQLLQDNTRPAVGQASFDKPPSSLGEAHLITAATLQECSNKLNQTILRLHVHLEEVNNGLPVLSLPAEKNRMMHSHHPGPRSSLVLENVSVGKEGRQTIVSTAGEDLEVKQATVGDRGSQFIGSVSNTALYDMIKDRSLR